MFSIIRVYMQNDILCYIYIYIYKYTLIYIYLYIYIYIYIYIYTCIYTYISYVVNTLDNNNCYVSEILIRDSIYLKDILFDSLSEFGHTC